MLTGDTDFYDMLVQNFQRRRAHQSGCLQDIYDGTVYKELGDYTSSSVLNLTAGLNTDGVEVFKSPATSLWPIYLRINEVPPGFR